MFLIFDTTSNDKNDENLDLLLIDPHQEIINTSYI